MLRGNRNNLFLLGHLSFVTKRRVNNNVCYEVCTDFFFILHWNFLILNKSCWFQYLKPNEKCRSWNFKKPAWKTKCIFGISCHAHSSSRAVKTCVTSLLPVVVYRLRTYPDTPRQLWETMGSGDENDCVTEDHRQPESRRMHFFVVHFRVRE